MTLTALNVLYLVLAVAVVAIAALSCVVLWQVSLVVAQLRTQHLPEALGLLREAQIGLKQVDAITDDVHSKLHKLDSALDAANSAVRATAETTVLVNHAIAQPAIKRTAAVLTGVRVAALHLWDRRHDLLRRPGRAPELTAPKPDGARRAPSPARR